MTSLGSPPPVPTPPAGWSYSGDPAASLKDQVRFLIGDTDPAQPLFSDAELSWLLTQSNDSPLTAAIAACEAAIGSFARLRDETVGQVSIKYSQTGAGYQALLAQLRRRLAYTGVPYAGGISISDKIGQRADGDRLKPSFIRDFLQNPDDPESDAGVDAAGIGGDGSSPSSYGL